MTSGATVTRSGERGVVCLVAMLGRLSDVDSARTPRSQRETPNMQELHHGSWGIAWQDTLGLSRLTGGQLISGQLIWSFNSFLY